MKRCEDCYLAERGLPPQDSDCLMCDFRKNLPLRSRFRLWLQDLALVFRISKYILPWFLVPFLFLVSQAPASASAVAPVSSNAAVNLHCPDHNCALLDLAIIAGKASPGVKLYKNANGTITSACNAGGCLIFSKSGVKQYTAYAPAMRSNGTQNVAKAERYIANDLAKNAAREVTAAEASAQLKALRNGTAKLAAGIAGPAGSNAIFTTCLAVNKVLGSWQKECVDPGKPN